MTIGSDFPACSAPLDRCSPLFNMERTITRKSVGQPDSVIFGSEDKRLSVAQAIKSHALDAAYQVRSEHKVGSIEVGKLADIVVLSENLFEIEPSDIYKKTAVLLTMVDGRVVYDKSDKK